jgi:hypothetical protein
MNVPKYALVACPETGQVEFARVKVGRAYCNACGSIDHEPDTQEPPF